MHKRVKDFILGIKQIHPEFFRDVDVLDCGSLDINGNNRQFFIDSLYTGIDIVDGKNVDVVICTEMLEFFFRRSLKKEPKKGLVDGKIPFPICLFRMGVPEVDFHC